MRGSAPKSKRAPPQRPANAVVVMPNPIQNPIHGPFIAAIMLLGALLTVSACNPWRHWEQIHDQHGDPARLSADYGLKPIELSASTTANDRQTARVVVSKEAIVVDFSPLWLSLPPKHREALHNNAHAQMDSPPDTQPYSHKPIRIPLKDWRADQMKGPLITELYDALQHALPIRRQWDDFNDDDLSQIPNRPSRRSLGTLSIVIDARMPAQLLFETIYTAAQSMYSTFDLLALHQNAWQTLRVEAPRMCQGTPKSIQIPPDPLDSTGTVLDALAMYDDESAQCVSADVELTKEGWMVRAQQGFGCGRHSNTEPRAIYHDKIVFGEGGTCPTVPRTQPADMHRALNEALGRLKILAQPCQGANVIFHGDNTMGELTAVLLRLHSQGFTFTQLAYSPDPVSAQCDLKPASMTDQNFKP